MTVEGWNVKQARRLLPSKNGIDQRSALEGTDAGWDWDYRAKIGCCAANVAEALGARNYECRR